MTQPNPSEPLREALEQIIRTLGPEAPEHDDVCEGCQHEIGEALDIARAALATPSTPDPDARRESQPEPLDVERLARALDSHNHVGLPSEVIIACGRGRLDGCVPNIAAEYARLSETPRSGVSELIGE